MAAVAVVDNRGGVQWQWQRWMASDGVGDGLCQGNCEAAQGEATQKPAGAMRGRGGKMRG